MSLNLPNSSGIYQILNLIDNKRYVGSSINIKGRLNKHISYLKRNIHTNALLQNAFNKYGIENFSFLVLELTSIEDLLIYEQKYIDEKSEYNIRKIAESNIGIKMSNITRDKMKNSRNKYLNNPSNLLSLQNKMSILGKEWKNKSRKKHTDEFKSKMSIRFKNTKRPELTGLKRSVEVKDKMSKIHKERYSNSETKEKHSDVMKIWWIKRKEKNINNI